jgi:hypothetical protein
MLKLLQPGIEPLGQFDLEDDDIELVRGAEVGFFRALDVTTDAYAADVFQQGPLLHIKLGDVLNDGELYGLVDEGTSPEYGTLFGSVIGVTAGQGTGFGALSSQGVVVVGPPTTTGSGKATLWTKPGLYGATPSGWESQVIFDGATLNGDLYGHEEDGTLDGKLTTDVYGQQVALHLGPVTDRSLVSTTTVAAGDAGEVEFAAIYLLGVQK